MISIEEFRKLALSLPDVEELPHFDMSSFRVKKKIFATLREKDKRAMLKFSLEDQSVFCAFEEASIFYPVPGTWGKQGATFVHLDKVKKVMFKDALQCAYTFLITKNPSTKLKSI